MAINEIVAAAGHKLAGLKLHQVHGEPRASDFNAAITDLEAIWRIVDPMIEAVGEHHRSELGLSTSEVREYYSNCLRHALEGNATAVIEQRRDDVLESLRSEQ